MEPFVEAAAHFQGTFVEVLFQTNQPKLTCAYMCLQQYLSLCVAALFNGGCREPKLSLLTNCGERGQQNAVSMKNGGINEIGFEQKLGTVDFRSHT